MAAEAGADGGLDVASLAREQESAALSLQLLSTVVLFTNWRALHYSLTAALRVAPACSAPFRKALREQRKISATALRELSL